ncbi:MAG TPA: cobalt ECF transporter T component CbiQ [Intrasporangiaceae bacterium]|nr:cobalt ECF transporter T component CbiQ [Intrasporangiaceae bacterium]
MGAPHGHTLHFHGHSLLHRIPAHAKLIGLLGVILVIVLTPRDYLLAFAGYAVIVSALVALSQVPPSYVLRRLWPVLPFLLAALVLPIVATGERVDVGPVSLAVEGLRGGLVLLLKVLLSATLAVLFAATTEPRDLVRGLDQLRLPQPLVQIMSFMLRYLEVVSDEVRRMSIALASRGFRARSLRHWPVLARTLGALFIRSFERGERVHLAMVSRGYTGRIPMQHHVATARDWITVAVVPLLAAAALLVAMLVPLGRLP